MSRDQSPGPDDPAAATDATLDPADVDSVDIEPIVRRAVRLEIRRLVRNAAQVLGGALFALFVLPALLAAVLPPLFDVGVPPGVFAVAGVLSCGLLVAYGWRLPPFR